MWVKLSRTIGNVLLFLLTQRIDLGYTIVYGEHDMIKTCDKPPLVGSISTSIKSRNMHAMHKRSCTCKCIRYGRSEVYAEHSVARRRYIK